MKKRVITLLLASGLFAVASCANTVSSSSNGNFHSRPQKSETESSSAIASETPAASSSKVEETSSSSKPASQSSSSKPTSSSSSVYVPPTPSGDSKWNINLSLSGLDFRNALGDLIQAKKTKSCSYSSCLDIGAKAAAYPTGSSKFVPFYHTTDTTTSTGGCNREHTWPNSRGSGTSGPGADPFIIRPTLTSENSSRGNYFYGSEKSNEWDPASCGFEAARGESARVILYAATAWYKNGLSLSNNPGDATSLKTMGTLKFLIQWNKKYAPTDMEIQINNYLDSQGYGRNPFVDHPEWAEKIWNENGVVGSTTGGTDTPTVTTQYTLIDALADIDNASAYIVTPASDATSEYYGMTAMAKSDSLPWYIVGAMCNVSDDKSTMGCSYENIAKFKFSKQSDGSYTIYNESAKVYLYNYVDGTHYSIGLAANPSSGSKFWDISANSAGGYSFKGKAGPYLEYYKGSFCGFQYEPKVGIYLYK